MICPACKAENNPGDDVCFTCGRALGALTQGSVIGTRYEVLSVLGRGGMGMVYKAHDRMLDEAVAIKVLRPEFTKTAEMAQRFRHEIKLARRVSHRNVCRIHEYGEDGDLRYISMEFLEGTDLKQILREKGNLHGDEAFDTCIQIAEGLQAIHDVGIIHRDLKTPNIMKDARGAIRLMDFGIAKEEGHGGGMTTTGQVMGTPEYMSPEQCRGEKIDTRSDIYAMGIVQYEIFTGQVPFRGDTPVATLFKHIQEPVPLEGGGPAARIPAAMVPVLRKALAKDRAERYASAAEVAAALRHAKEQASREQAAMHTPPPVERRRSSRLEYPVDLILSRGTEPGSGPQAPERTYAENISRGGACVLTSMVLQPGDVVHVEEVGGRKWKTRAEVKNAYVGRDNIRRLNLRFLDEQAPDHLVKTGDFSRPLTPKSQPAGRRRG
jgi:serine/threonine protein kinase